MEMRERTGRKEGMGIGMGLGEKKGKTKTNKTCFSIS